MKGNSYFLKPTCNIRTFCKKGRNIPLPSTRQEWLGSLWTANGVAWAALPGRIAPHAFLPPRSLNTPPPASSGLPSSSATPPAPPPQPRRGPRPSIQTPPSTAAQASLPLPTVLAKLKHDPQKLSGWEAKLLPEPSTAPSSHKNAPASEHRHDQTTSHSNSTGSLGGSGTACDLRSSPYGFGVGSDGCLGRIVEVFRVATPTGAAVVSWPASWHSKHAAREELTRQQKGRSSTSSSSCLSNAQLSASFGALPVPATVRRTRGSVASQPGSDSAGLAARLDLDQGSDAGEDHPHVMLRVARRAALPAYGFEGTEEYIVRLDVTVVPYADVSRRVLFVRPDKDLLHQGRSSLLLQLLRRELQPFWQQQPQQQPPQHVLPPASGPQGENAGAGRQGDPAATADPPVAPQPLDPELSPIPPGASMPSRRQLLEAGRRDLVELVAEAGGACEVALRLGLRSARRPRGYWCGPGSWERLGEEISAFVAGCWMELPHPDQPEKSYFYNSISGRTTWRRPPPPRRLLARPSSAQGGAAGELQQRWVVSEAAADRVMPSRSAILQAQRRDLHNAISFHGGYLAVAQRLGRRVTWALSTRVYDTPAAIRRKLRSVARELELPQGVMPSQTELLQYGHGALLAAVRRFGGLQAVAGSLRLRSRARRRPRGTWADPGRLAEELAAFARGTQPHNGQCSQLGSGAAGRKGDTLPADGSCTILPRGSASEDDGGSCAAQTSADSTMDSPLRRSASGAGQPSLAPESAVAAAATGESSTAHTTTATAEGAAAAAAAALPTRKQLVAAGRYDLLYGLELHSRRRDAIAEMAGLRSGSRQGTNRNVLSFEAVVRAIQAGCQTPKTIREYLLHQGMGQDRSGQQQQQDQAPLHDPQQVQEDQRPGRQAAQTAEPGRRGPAGQVLGSGQGQGVGKGPGGPEPAAVIISRQHLTSYLARKVREGLLVKVSHGTYSLP